MTALCPRIIQVVIIPMEYGYMNKSKLGKLLDILRMITVFCGY